MPKNKPKKKRIIKKSRPHFGFKFAAITKPKESAKEQKEAREEPKTSILQKLVSDHNNISKKELDKLENRVEKSNEYLVARVRQLESAFISFSDTIENMQAAHDKLLKDKERLESKYREVHVDGVSAAAAEAVDKVKQSVHENAEIVEHAIAGKEADYEKIMRKRDNAREVTAEDEQVIEMIKKGGSRYALERVKDNDLAKLFLLIHDVNRIKTSDAAHTLSMDEAVVDGIAEVLKAHRLIKVQYPAFGKPVLTKI